jgi:hypothetical protein
MAKKSAGSAQAATKQLEKMKVQQLKEVQQARHDHAVRLGIIAK